MIEWASLFRDLSMSLCVSIACFGADASNGPSQDGSDVAERNLKPVAWPCKRVHQVQVNEGGYLPLTPPIDVRSNEFTLSTQIEF